MTEDLRRLMADRDASPFGSLLRQLRLSRDLTQEELADRTGVSARSISDLERGINLTARKETARLLAEGLGLTGEARWTFESVARGRATPARRAVESSPPSIDGVAAATRTLPRDVASFVGRETELRRLETDVADAADSGGVVSICAIGGMAGIGKTAFAVHSAHVLARQFPDGQIFLPLHGHTPGHQPVDPADALANLLQTAGVATQQIPVGVEARARLWRDRMVGKRLLLLLDDAAGHEQVRPLLPSTAGSLVLVTSRKHLTALEDVQLISLDILSPDEADRLLLRLAHRSDLRSQADAVREINRLCGYLPLAIAMLGRQLYHHPTWTAAGLAADLAVAHSRLELIHAENLSVRAAFDLSYEELTPTQQRLFRRLGMHPGTDIDQYAAAALDDTDVNTARRNLADLYDHYLLIESSPGRYRFHDLINEHSKTLAALDPVAERDAATDRLLAYYLHIARTGGHLLARRTPTEMSAGPPTAPICSPDLSERQDAISYLDAERVNIHAAAIQAAASDRPDYAIAIPTAMHGYLRHQGHWEQVLILHNVALDVARRTCDKRAEANALTDLGDIQYLDGDYEAAIQSLHVALTLHRESNDTHGEAHALTVLGYVHHLIGNNALAAANLERAAKLYHVHDDSLGVAGALAYLGNVQRAAGNYAAAKESLARSVEIHGAMGNDVRQAGSLNFLGVVHTMTGDLATAVDFQTRALGLYRGLGNRFGEANALRDLGFAHMAQGDYTAATDTLTRALALQRDLGSRMGEVRTQQYLGILQQLTGDQAAAEVNLTSVLRLHREMGNRLGEAEVLNALGELVMIRGDQASADAWHQQAMVIATSIGARPEQARAYEGLGRCQLRNGQPGYAAISLHRALAIYESIGSPRAGPVRELINSDELIKPPRSAARRAARDRKTA